MISFVIILLMSLHVSVIPLDNDKNCRERSRLIDTEKGDLYALIDATPGEKLILQCHYCNENDDARAKIWYKVDEFGVTSPHEVDLDMNNNATKNRVHINTEHSLIIHNFTANDTGLYYCQRFEEENEEEKYNYLVDLIFQDNGTISESGNFTDWRKYYEEYFVPINILFKESEGVEFKRVRNDFKLKIEIITEWKSWGHCEVCGRPKNEGRRKKDGLCRLKITPQLNSTKPSTLNHDENFLINANEVACRSQILGRLLPGISNLTRIIPDFIQYEHCEGICNPDAEGVGKGWKTGKTAAFKYRKTFVLAEDSHLTIICPESNLDNHVIWKKNGKYLKAGESVIPPNPEEEPRILVDTFNTLYLVGVRESEEGNYTCQVDNIRMQQVRVYVISKSRLLTQAFVRHMMYLGIILSLTLPCYLAGVVITCNRKHTFKGYEELKEMEKGRRDIGGYENFA